MKINRKLNVAIIGCGNIGFFNDMGNRKKSLSYISSIKKLSNDFKLVSVAEHKVSKLMILKKRIKNVNFYKDYLCMLNKEIIDICIIATENKFHFEILKKLSFFDIKAVITEKPFLTSLNQAKKIIQIYKKKKIILSVNYSRRFLKIFKDIKTQVNIKKFNKILIVTTRGFVNNGCHYIDLLFWYFGRVKKIDVIFLKKSRILKNDYAGLLKITFFKNFEAYLFVLDINNIFVEEIIIEGHENKITINSRNKISYIFKKKNIYQNINYSFALSNHLISVKDSIIKRNKSINSALTALKVSRFLEKTFFSTKAKIAC
jgi:predicted dehydrogenase